MLTSEEVREIEAVMGVGLGVGPRGGREAGGGGMKKPNPCISVYGPGPDGARCKTCAHLDGHPGAGRIYWKCLLRTYSHGPATDHRVNWPACGKYEEGEA
jgi:hypothetical protein